MPDMDRPMATHARQQKKNAGKRRKRRTRVKKTTLDTVRDDLELTKTSY